ncbi:MAG TPA: chromosomal replication initiator protein DnaA, partial [Solirubrobacteraceae bacterium]
MTRELDHAWQRITEEMRRVVTDSTYAIWLEPLRPVGLSAGRLLVTAPDELRTWVSDRYGPLLERVARHVLDAAVRVEVVPPDAVPDAVRPAATPDLVSPPDADVIPDQPFNPKLTFDQFVIGDSNRFAHAAALAVAEMPGQAYNPLYICGPPGLGKTHLLHAIANYVVRFGGGLTVRYTTVESFTSEFVSALRGGSIDAFKTRFRHNDVLLIDDVQFLAAKARTEEELFHTFNALYDTGSQLVLTSDVPPRDLLALEDRLRERFAAGLVCDVRPPDASTRLTILRKRAAHDGITPEGPDALEVIAERITDNVRALEGALIRVVAFASLTRRPVTAALAAEVLDGLYGRPRSVRRTIEDVQATACEAFDVTREDLVSSSRAQRLIWPRQVAMYLARELTDQTLPAIGRAFGNRDHTTVLHACRRTAERMAADPAAYET